MRTKSSGGRAKSGVIRAKSGGSRAKSRLVDPIRHKHIRVARASIVTVAAPGDFLAIGREHDERVELSIERNLLQTASIHIHHKDVEWKSNFAFVVATKQHSLAVGMEVGRPIRIAQISNLSNVAAIGIRNENLQVGWLY